MVLASPTSPTMRTAAHGCAAVGGQVGRLGGSLISLESNALEVGKGDFATRHEAWILLELPREKQEKA